MSYGVTATLSELVALQKYAQQARFQPGKKASLRAGGYLSRVRGRGMDFAEVRNYQAGDEIRHMEWRITARTGRPHVKLYQEERERPLVFLLDFNPSMFFGTKSAFKSVVMARLSAILAWMAIKQGDRVGGLLFSAQTHHEFTPRGHQTGMMPFLAAISQYASTLPQTDVSARSLSTALVRLKRVARPGSTLVLISDFYHMDEEVDNHLSRLSAHNDVLVYHVGDPIEFTPPPAGRYAITDKRQETWFDMRHEAVRLQYAALCQERINAIQLPCRRLHIPYIPVMTDADLPGLAAQTFRRRSHE